MGWDGMKLIKSKMEGRGGDGGKGMVGRDEE